jgi:hypothetical protein
MGCGGGGDAAALGGGRVSNLTPSPPRALVIAFGGEVLNVVLALPAEILL